MIVVKHINDFLLHKLYNFTKSIYKLLGKDNPLWLWLELPSTLCKTSVHGFKTQIGKTKNLLGQTDRQLIAKYVKEPTKNDLNRILPRKQRFYVTTSGNYALSNQITRLKVGTHSLMTNTQRVCFYAIFPSQRKWSKAKSTEIFQTNSLGMEEQEILTTLKILIIGESGVGKSRWFSLWVCVMCVFQMTGFRQNKLWHSNTVFTFRSCMWHSSLFTLWQ